MATYRRRRLPHIDAIGQPVFLTWRLHGSLPSGRAFPEDTSSGKSFVAMDWLLDNARLGPLYLKKPEIADMIVQSIYTCAEELGHFDLHAYVVMANHVHLLVTPHVAISKLTQTLKRFTAREANRMLNLTGQTFWAVESYDRVVRDRDEFQRIVRYVEFNPVKAGLVTDPEDFPWSSGRPIENRPQIRNLPYI